ncbi:hypothetical protein IJ674_01580 [bacterium]|nr:hypothetical protein [bacterium]
MNVEIKFGSNIQIFEDKQNIVIGTTPDCDFVIDGTDEIINVKMVFSPKYNSYVLVNSDENSEVLFNNKTFKKVLVPRHFSIGHTALKESVLVVVNIETNKNLSADTDNTVLKTAVASATATATTEKAATQVQNNRMINRDKKDIFNGNIENNRIAIVKEIGYKIQALKNQISSLGKVSFVANAAILVLSIICSFGMTNFILHLPIDTSKGVLNLTTNYGFLIAISLIVFAVSFAMKQSVFTLIESSQNKRYGENNDIQRLMVYASCVFMLVIYAINLFYYKDIAFVASIFVSLLFVGALAIVSAASGYFKYQLKTANYQLMNVEYREDFETTLKGYRSLISQYINSLSDNKLDSIKDSLLNAQIKMSGEILIGMLTAPFLAYGVSNTLASCFPEAAGWIRISGLRFSPIFLVLATFLIIFAFFSFVRAFTIGKQIKASEIIKFDGFHDYASHGVNILGLDAIKGLHKEKNITMAIACVIVAIEFTMNVSYFIQEIGGDISGMFISSMAAFVPTALLIAETMMLSGTMHKINNYNEVFQTLD